ncbi:hypothetical protein KAI32_04335 [Candidatus Pacearchaeota archaeon]|nr:hypothetical protein [Candidatus Pacearchaeota archaeon]
MKKQKIIDEYHNLMKKELSKNSINYNYDGYKNSSDFNVKRIFLDIKNTSFKGYFVSIYHLTFHPVCKDFQKLLLEETKITMIHGKKDSVFPYGKIKRMTKEKNIKLITISDSNHLPLLNSTKKLSQIIFGELTKEYLNSFELEAT